MAKRIIPPQSLAVLSTQHLSAIGEIRRQLKQAYALVHGARVELLSINQDDSSAYELLDMAEDILGDREYINRMDELKLREVAHV
jgi:hypothetical protein